MWTIHVAKLQIMVTLNSFGTCGEQQSQHVRQHFLAMRVMYIVSNSTNQMYTHSPAFLCLMHAFEDSAFSYKEVQCCICIPRLWCNLFQESGINVWTETKYSKDDAELCGDRGIW